MATLIPALGACVSRMTASERRLAERLEHKLDDDYLLWYDVPMGPRYWHPDFCVMHPRRGILILEVKDWRLSTIQRADKEVWEILDHGISENVINSLAQVRCPTGTRRRHTSRQARLPIASWRHVAVATPPRVNAASLLDDSDSEAELPGIMRVMDLQQQQLARSLDDDHRVIHGMAGSGKAMILGLLGQGPHRREQTRPDSLLQRVAGREAGLGDTLFARITPCLENGKTGFVQFLPTDEAVAFGSTEFIVLRSRTLTPEFVYLLARSDPFRENAIKSMSGASGRQRVREACFNTFLMANPDGGTLAKFEAMVRPMFKLIQSLAMKNQNLRTTRDLLLPKLISGELDVSTLPEPQAETA